MSVAVLGGVLVAVALVLGLALAAGVVVALRRRS